MTLTWNLYGRRLGKFDQHQNIHDMPTSFKVARWAYSQIESSVGLTWQRGEELVGLAAGHCGTRLACRGLLFRYHDRAGFGVADFQQALSRPGGLEIVAISALQVLKLFESL